MMDFDRKEIIMQSPPSRGAWIEMKSVSATPAAAPVVAPLAGGVD